MVSIIATVVLASTVIHSLFNILSFEFSIGIWILVKT